MAKIAAMEAKWLRVEIPAEKQHFTDYGQVASYATTLLEIRTEDGLVGYGEARIPAGWTDTAQHLVALLNEEFAPLLIGEDARDITRIWTKLYSGKRAGHALARGHGFPIGNRRGANICALSAVDVALWDLKGKALGVPVYELLGGKCRDRLPTYASGGWAGVDGIGDELRGFVERGGFEAVKMRVGAGDGSVNASVRRVEAAREALGEDIRSLVDAHGTFAVPEAKEFARRVADCNLHWFEEPISQDNKRGTADVRAMASMAIAAGEREHTRFEAKELLDLRAVDILQPDLAVCGGLTEGMRIAALASCEDVRVAPHLFSGAVLFAASLHYVAACPNAYIVEYSLGHNPFFEHMVPNLPKNENGWITWPDGPGLGIEIDAEFVEAHRVG